MVIVTLGTMVAAAAGGEQPIHTEARSGSGGCLALCWRPVISSDDRAELANAFRVFVGGLLGFLALGVTAAALIAAPSRPARCSVMRPTASLHVIDHDLEMGGSYGRIRLG
jgi:hypothetical protein